MYFPKCCGSHYSSHICTVFGSLVIRVAALPALNSQLPFHNCVHVQNYCYRATAQLQLINYYYYYYYYNYLDQTVIVRPVTAVVRIRFKAGPLTKGSATGIF